MHVTNGASTIAQATNDNDATVIKSDGSGINVAIVGGGIVGCVTALGLLKRGITVKIYEQSRSFREIGAGVAFTTNAQKCMELTDPNILRAMKAVSTKNELAYYTYKDGYHAVGDDPNDMSEKELFRLHAGESGFDGCLRAQFLDEMVKFIPPDVVEFRKKLYTYVVPSDQGPITLKFEDGTSATADAVIGCDGIRSRVRQILLGEANPSSYPSFTHKVAFRGLVPMDRAVASLGEEKAHNQCMHMGPHAHVLNFPVAQHKFMNVVAFVTQPNWPHEGTLVAPSARRGELVEAFKGWNPAVRAIVGLLDEPLDKWAIFDTYENPAPTFARGRVCLAGDAAHASSPHHGAGAGFGIEDALALASVFEEIKYTPAAAAAAAVIGRGQGGDGSGGNGVRKMKALTAAFGAYDSVRRERSQWLVQSSRQVCETYEWNNPECRDEPEKCLRDIEWRAHRIWYFDIEGMIGDVRAAYRGLCPG
ncbi:MAG: hypothetical protein Q9227_003093 [Pyrenula ochraceoflavens]